MDRKSEINHGVISSVLEVDRTRLPSGPEHFLRTTFTIRNNWEKPILIIFNSGQQFDFFIEDESGRRYWKWSEGKFFPMMIVEKELRKEPWVYQVNLPTTDHKGQALAAGTYVLRATLHGDREVKNRIKFQIH